MRIIQNAAHDALHMTDACFVKARGERWLEAELVLPSQIVLVLASTGTFGYVSIERG
jgi:hypothetical protein